jgi:hypothetical protein
MRLNYEGERMKRRLFWASCALLALPLEASAQPHTIGKALTACIVQAAEENRPVAMNKEKPVAQIACDDDGARYFYDALETLGAETSDDTANGSKLITRRFGDDIGVGASQCQRKVNAAGTSSDDDYHCWIHLDVSETVMSGWAGKR